MGFIRDCMEIFKKKRKIFLVAAFYAIILAAFFLLSKSLSLFVLPDKQLLNPVFAIIMLAAYFLVLIFIYSFFKLGIIQIVEKNKLAKKSFVVLGSFFLFNLVSFAIAFAIVSALGSLIAYSFNNLLIAGTIFFIIFMIFYLPFLAFSQFEFVMKGKIFRSMGTAWKTLFSKKLGSYFILVLWNIIVSAAFLAIYSLIFYGIGSLYKIAFIDNNSKAAVYTTIYNLIFDIPLAVFFILLISLDIYLLRKIKG